MFTHAYFIYCCHSPRLNYYGGHVASLNIYNIGVSAMVFTASKISAQ
jgi:hypothetical protein